MTNEQGGQAERLQPRVRIALIGLTLAGVLAGAAIDPDLVGQIGWSWFSGWGISWQ